MPFAGKNRVFSLLKIAKQILFTLICAIIGLALLAFNRYYLYSDVYSTIMDIQVWSLFFLFVLYILTLFFGKNRQRVKRILLILFSLILFSELILAFKSLEKYRRDQFVQDYSGMDCTELLARFELDKERSKFIYTSYGFIANYSLEDMFREEYGVEVVVIGGGCIGSDSSHCYNEVLMDYLGVKEQ